MIKERIGSLFYNSGFDSEIDYWKSASGINEGSLIDHMIKALQGLGYDSRKPQDLLNMWVVEKSGNSSTNDGLRAMFNTDSATIRNYLLPS